MLIAFVFSLSITTKSLFEWVMYYKHLQSDSQYVQSMLQIQEIFMPLLWDVLPVCAIFYLHFVNFSNTCSVEECDRQTDVSIADRYSELDDNSSQQDKKMLHLRITQERLR